MVYATHTLRRLLKHACAQGEHGTGRNMAPFVEMEWGRKATGLMWDLKELFDPDYVLNPGVVLNHVSFPSHFEHCCKSCQFFCLSESF